MRLLPRNGPIRKSICRLGVPIAVLALVIGMTLGEAWHSHIQSTPENCTICHLSHQAVEPAVVAVCTEIFVPEGPGPEPLRTSFLSGLVAPRVPARAPPAWS
jgi:hypothetical protein